MSSDMRDDDDDSTPNNDYKKVGGDQCSTSSEVTIKTNHLTKVGNYCLNARRIQCCFRLSVCTVSSKYGFQTQFAKLKISWFSKRLSLHYDGLTVYCLLFLASLCSSQHLILRHKNSFFQQHKNIKTNVSQQWRSVPSVFSNTPCTTQYQGGTSNPTAMG